MRATLFTLVLIGLVAGCCLNDDDSPSTTLSGTITFEPEIAVNFVDQKPNSTAGLARLAGAAGVRSPRILRGSTGLRIRTWALGEDGVRAGVLFGEDSRDLPGGWLRAGFIDHRLAVSARRMFVLMRSTSPEVRDRIRVRSRVCATPPSEFEVPFDKPLSGMAALLDCLFVLRSDGHIAALDPDRGAVIAILDLETERFDNLAGGHELARGGPRLFAHDVQTGELNELRFEKSGDAWSLRPGESIAKLTGEVVSLSYDGVFLHLLRRDGSVELFDPDSGPVATVPGAGAHCIAALVDPGLDAFRLRVESSSTVELRSSGDGQSRLFVLAVDRMKLLQGRQDAVLFLARNGEKGLSLPPGQVDLVVGATRGGGEYELRIATSGDPVDPPAVRRLTNGDAVSLVKDHIGRLLESHLTAARVAALYADFRPPPCRAGRVVVRARDDLPESIDDRFRIALRRATPAGHAIYEFEACHAWTPRKARTLNGAALPAEGAREQGRQLLALLAALEGRDEVVWAEPELYGFPQSLSNDPFYNRQAWYYEQVRLPPAWSLTTGDAGVIIGVVDSGVRRENRDIVYRSDLAYDLVSDENLSGDGDGIDPDPYDEGGPESHGTHSAGIATAIGNNGEGGTGVMWTGTPMHVRVINIAGFGTMADIAEGVRFAAGLVNASGELPAAPSSVINLGITGDFSNVLAEAVRDAHTAGIPVVAPVGNISIIGSGIAFPASMPETIAVSATNSLKRRAWYSATGSGIDVACPGGEEDTDDNGDGFPDEIYSTIGVEGGGPDGYYYQFQAGTSRACAICSGVIGLMKSRSPNLTPEEIRSILRSTAEDLGAPGTDTEFGAGLVDALGAVNESAPRMFLSSPSMDFALNGTALVIQALNTGSAIPQITAVRTEVVSGGSEDWFVHEVAPDGFTISTEADRAQLPGSGTYQVRMIVETDLGTDQTLFSLTEDPGAALPDVGTVQVQLRNATGGLISSTTTSLAEGYFYSFPGSFPNGEYYVIAGADSNGNGNGAICDAGERCGFYPDSLAVPRRLLVTQAMPLHLDILLRKRD